MPTDPAPRQTLSFLQRRFAEAGVRPKTQSGQNFLIDLNLLDVLLEAAAVTREDVVLEVGTGTGSLTARLAQQAAAVVTVEVDPAMFQLAAEELHRFENVVMLQADALRGKNRLNPAVLEAVADQLAAVPGRRLKLVANLPFNIATPLLSNLLAHESPPRTMTATIQKEMAERLVARPGTKDYGALSIWIQSQCRVEILRTLPPEAFLAPAQGLLGLYPNHPRRRPAGTDSQPAVLSRFRPRDVPPPPQVPPLGTAHGGQRWA